eukprot:TRINITY_DN4990_c0_g1_i1.p1 TRINITY_DN4990_c0_g1~~TRINITY_DN4990_c0_g1_i1.p1  ORF type:complete len:110 (-),score=18.39 TRINITY_DN4990_c0_g1_i1:56-385(-)
MEATESRMAGALAEVQAELPGVREQVCSLAVWLRWTACSRAPVLASMVCWQEWHALRVHENDESLETVSSGRLGCGGGRAVLQHRLGRSRGCHQLMSCGIEMYGEAYEC